MGEQYQFWRALIEEALRALGEGTGEGAHDDLRAALRVYLALHCRRCGQIVPLHLRERGYCAWCARPPLPALDQALREGDDDLPF